MSRSVCEVTFADGSCLFLVYDGTVDSARLPLFESVEAAWEWYLSGSPSQPAPDKSDIQEETVTVVSDRALDKRFTSAFASRACRKSMWLTGPQDLEEALRELEDPDDRGYGFP